MAAGDLLQALLDTQYKPSEDIYGLGALGIAKTMPDLVNPYGSTGQNIGGVVGAGILSALLAGLAKNETDTENLKLLPLENQYLSGSPEQRLNLAAQEPRLARYLAPAVSTSDFINQADIANAKAKAEALQPLDLQKLDYASNLRLIEQAAKEHTVKLDAGTQRMIKDLSGTTAAIAALNDNEQRIQGLEGEDSITGGMERSAYKLVPGSKTYNYVKGLPFLADPLTVGLSGTSRMGILQKTLESLNPGFGQSKSSMIDISNQAKQAMIDKGSKLLETLDRVGYPLQDLQELKDKFGQAMSGTLIDDSYIKQRQDQLNQVNQVNTTPSPEIPPNAVATGKTTKDGKPIYMLDGQKGVFE